MLSPNADRTIDMRNRFMKGTGRWGSRLFGTERTMLSLRPGYRLGVAISERSMRLCLVKKRLHRFHVVSIETAPQAFEHTDSWPGRLDFAAGFAARYLHDRKLSGIPVNIGLLGEDIAFRRLYLPRIPAKELAAAILWEGKKLFPFDLGRSIVDYCVVEHSERNGVERLGINIIAGQSDLIDAIYEKFGTAGVVVGQIGYLPGFIAQSMRFTTAPRRDACQVIICLDEVAGSAIFVHKGALEFVQRFASPLPALTGPETVLAYGESIASELVSFFDLYNGQNPENAVSSVLLCGKNAASRDLSAQLTAATGLPCHRLVEDGSFLSALNGIDSDEIQRYLDAIMTALAAPGHRPLLPFRLKTREQKRRLRLQLGMALAFALITIAGMQWTAMSKTSVLQRELDAQKTAAHTLEQSAAYQSYISLADKLKRDRIYISRMSGTAATHLHVLLKELSLILPDNVNLTAIKVEDAEGRYLMTVDGHVRLSDFSPEIVLAQYIEALEKSPFFDLVTVANHHKQRIQDDFDLTFELKLEVRI